MAKNSRVLKDRLLEGFPKIYDQTNHVVRYMIISGAEQPIENETVRDVIEYELWEQQSGGYYG